MNKPCTHEIVQEAMRIVSKDVIPPKYVRDMSKIPIAEELSKKYTRLRSTVALKDLSDFAIEFAKLHVEAALKEASEKAHHYHVATWKCEPKGLQPEVNKDSILNAYSLNNIK